MKLVLPDDGQRAGLTAGESVGPRSVSAAVVLDMRDEMQHSSLACFTPRDRCNILCGQSMWIPPLLKPVWLL